MHIFWLQGFRWLHRQGNSTAMSVSRPGREGLHRWCFPRGAGGGRPHTSAAGADRRAASSPCAHSVRLSGFKGWSQPLRGAERECMSQAKWGPDREGNAVAVLQAGEEHLPWVVVLPTRIGPSSSQCSPAKAGAQCAAVPTLLPVQPTSPNPSPSTAASHPAALWHWDLGTHHCCLRRKVSLKKLTLSNQILHSAFNNRSGS